MTELTDLEICKRIAEIEHGIAYIDSDDTGNFINLHHPMSDRSGEMYNPFNDALNHQLMIKYRVEVGLYGTWYGCFQGGKPKGSDGCLSYELNLNKAILLAIIESKKES